MAPLVAAQPGITAVGATYQQPQPIIAAPGQLITILLTGLRTTLPTEFGASVRAGRLPLPNALGGISAVARQTRPDVTLPLPILAVERADLCGAVIAAADCSVTAVTVQIPYNVALEFFPCGAPFCPQFLDVTFSEGARTSPPVRLLLRRDSLHQVQSCDLVVEPQRRSPCYDVVSFADGSPVLAHGQEELPRGARPARTGEVVSLYVLGAGRVRADVQAGEAAPNPATPVVSPPLVEFRFGANLGPQESAIDHLLRSSPLLDPALAPYLPEFMGLVPNLVGLYQVNVRVPAPSPGTPPCGRFVRTNVTVSLQGASSFTGAAFCVELPTVLREP